MKRTVLIGILLLVAGVVPMAGQSPAPAPTPSRVDMKTALETALASNYAIRDAREAIAEQEGLVVEVRADALPAVTLDGSYFRLDEDLDEGGFPGIPLRNQSWNIGLQVVQTLYSGGSVAAAMELQEIVQEAVLLDLQAVIEDQLLLVRSQFYTVLLARDSIEVAEANVELLEEQLETANNLFDAGNVSSFDVLRAEVDLANAQPPLIEARNNYRVAVDELLRLMGVRGLEAEGGMDSLVVEGELEYAPFSYDLASALAQAEANRVEIKRLQLNEEASTKGIDIARSGYRPEVSLIAAYDVNNSAFSNDIEDARHGWALGVRFSWDIWDGRRTRGAVQQALVQRRRAKLATESLKLAIDGEVRQAVSDLQQADELVRASQRTVERAEEALRQVRARYESGQATQLEVTETQVALTSARNNELRANFSHEVAAAAYRRALGTADSFER